MIGKHTGTNTGEFIAFLPIKHLAVRTLSVDEEAGSQCTWLSPLVPRQPTMTVCAVTASAMEGSLKLTVMSSDIRLEGSGNQSPGHVSSTVVK